MKLILTLFLTLMFAQNTFAGEYLIWREDGFSNESRDVIKNMSEPQKAIVAYLSASAGSGCKWYEDDNEDYIQCDLTKELNVGPQCLDEHLGLIKKWFGNTAPLLDSEYSVYEICYSVPLTATSQSIFERILFTSQGDKVLVEFDIVWPNARTGESPKRSFKQEFSIKENLIEIIKTEINE